MHKEYTMNKPIILPHDHGTAIAALAADIPCELTIIKMADTFQMISDSTRLKILWLLCHSEDCVTNIGAALNTSAPAISHHLRILKQAGLITSNRIGKEVHYTLAKTKEAQLVHRIVDATFEMNCKESCCNPLDKLLNLEEEVTE